MKVRLDVYLLRPCWSFEREEGCLSVVKGSWVNTGRFCSTCLDSNKDHLAFYHLFLNLSALIGHNQSFPARFLRFEVCFGRGSAEYLWVNSGDSLFWFGTWLYKQFLACCCIFPTENRLNFMSLFLFGAFLLFVLLSVNHRKWILFTSLAAIYSTARLQLDLSRFLVGNFGVGRSRHCWTKIKVR